MQQKSRGQACTVDTVVDESFFVFLAESFFVFLAVPRGQACTVDTVVLCT